jgi:hypothetical protein
MVLPSSGGVTTPLSPVTGGRITPFEHPLSGLVLRSQGSDCAGGMDCTWGRASALCALAAPGTPTAASVKRTNRRFCLMAAPLRGRHSFANAASPYEFRRFHVRMCAKVDTEVMLLDSTLDRARKSVAAAVSCDPRGTCHIRAMRMDSAGRRARLQWTRGIGAA